MNDNLTVSFIYVIPSIERKFGERKGAKAKQFGGVRLSDRKDMNAQIKSGLKERE